MVKIYTMGCRLNQYDSARIKALLDEYDGDLIILNGCIVTKKAESEVFKMVRRLRRENPSSLLVIFGCPVKGINDIEKKLKDANLFVKDEVELLEKLNIKNKKEMVPQFDEKTRAFLKIQEGCDRRCSYCIVPYLRGESRSRPIDEIKNEFINLLKRGFKEIVITGTNISDYGKEFNIKLTDLLKELFKKEGDFRLRLSSVEISAIDDELINLMIKEKRFCDHLHIPLQSLSKKVLKDMNRDDDLDKIFSTIKNIKEKMPQTCIGCDILIGFPTESEEDFLTTYKNLSELPLSYFHTFSFSKRPFTEAYKYKELPKEIVHKRTKMVIELSRLKREKFYYENLGKTLKGLTLSSKMGKKRALSSNFIEFTVDNSLEKNKFFNFTLLINENGELYGEVV